MGDSTVTGARVEPADVMRPTARLKGNVLLAAADPLLELACRLRLRQFDEPLEPLRDRLCAMVDAFNEAARRAGVGERTRDAARYCLCTFVDEIVAATPSGGAGAWASRSLLILFHGEASGGERFFSILHELARDAGAHLEALELIYVMLALGMEGRYRLLADGRPQLEAVRDELRRLVMTERGARPIWPGDGDGGDDGARARGVYARGGRPIACVAGSLALLVLLTVTLDARLHVQAGPVIEALARIGVASKAVAKASPSTLVDALAGRLAPDLAARQIALDGAADRAVLTLGADGLFASGSSTVFAQRVALLRRIGSALRDLDVRIVVTGYTDDELPSRGKPSNWQLSLARATAVVNILRDEGGDPARFLAQGRGDAAPLVSNDSAANRALNRRVVVTVVAPKASI